MLLDSGPDGEWATSAMGGRELAAPDLIRSEAANIVRRQELAGLVSSDQAVQAHTDLLDLSIEEWPYMLLADRSWELRHNLSIYDASYVALAELVGSTLVTLDRRMAGAPGIRCPVSVP
jgi:predicted nucleic acid-binding protein